MVLLGAVLLGQVVFDLKQRMKLKSCACIDVPEESTYDRLELNPVLNVCLGETLVEFQELHVRPSSGWKRGGQRLLSLSEKD